MSGKIVPHQRSYPTAYALWCFCFLSVCGVHRIYARRYFSGFFYLITFGFFGIGQFIDLFMIPGMIDEENLKIKALYGYQPDQGSFYQTPESIVINLKRNDPPQVNGEKTAEKPLKGKDIDRAILQTCRKSNGATLAEIFLEVDEDYEKLETRVQDLMKKNLLYIDNRADDGAVIYKIN
ncbi:TM2 domain-containing protein [Dactylococcopsis salina]|uniref:TM2 domain-containing protein n=1 Tax=Dactylococcopsis salina (strain PCC 8305) TaxID=13035 RepID=K9YYL2_DACS8|nr:TM2 domain-containing protein [Dactylococcopsis salina]AFZ51582.1 TM2 domain-containing protein [Dactylococcopsis salina PCC 8305]